MRVNDEYLNGICYPIKQEVFNALKYVEEQTEYDVGMIWKDLLRKTPLCDLKNMLNLNYILVLFLHNMLLTLINYGLKIYSYQ